MLQRGVISNWAVTGLSVVYSLLITPMVVRTLRSDLYGIWSFLNGLTAYSALLYLGLGSSLIKYVAKHRAAGNQDAVSRLLSVVLTIYTGTGLFCLVVMVGLSPWIPGFFGEPLDDDMYTTTSLVSAVLGIQLFFTFVASGFSGGLYGYDRFDLVNLIRIVAMIIRFLAVVIFIQGDSPLLRLAVITTLSSALEATLLGIMCLRQLPWLRLKAVRPRASEMRLLYRFGLQSFLIIFSIRLISYTDTTVIAFLLGASSVAIYTLPQQLIEYSRLCITGFTSVFLPSLTILYDRGDLSAMRSAFLRNARFSCYMATFVVVNMIFLGSDFLTVWVGAEYGEPAQWILVFLGTASVLQVLSVQMPIAFLQAMNILKVPSWTVLAEASLNLILSIVFARAFGLNGVALATLIPSLLLGFMIIPRYLSRKLDLNPWRLYREALVPSAGLLAILVVLYTVVLARVPGDSFLTIVAKALCSVPVAVLPLLTLFPAEDKRLVLRFLGIQRSSE